MRNEFRRGLWRPALSCSVGLLRHHRVLTLSASDHAKEIEHLNIIQEIALAQLLTVTAVGAVRRAYIRGDRAVVRIGEGAKRIALAELQAWFGRGEEMAVRTQEPRQ